MKKWEINIDNLLGGFSPGFYLNDYPSYGNKNMAGKMLNVDLTDPTKIQQGPGLTEITNPTGGSLPSLLKSVLDYAVSANITYGVGRARFYELTSTQIATASTPGLPHTISGSPTCEDICYYAGKVYYSYNTTVSANVGMYDLTRDAETDFSDAWAVAAKSASISGGGADLAAYSPLPLEVGGNNYMYLGNKNRVSYYDGINWVNNGLDLQTNFEVQDIKWNANRLWVVANQTELPETNKTFGSLFVWDGISPSWEDELRINGRFGGTFVDNAILYLFYQDISDTSGGYKLGFLSGGQIKELCTFSGSLPGYHQITKYKNFIIWVSGQLIYGFGAINPNLPPMLFQIAATGPAANTTIGALACPFGTPWISCTDEISMTQLAKFSGYVTNSYIKSIMFPIGKGIIDKVIAYCDGITSPGRVDISATVDRGLATYLLGSITETGLYRKEFPAGYSFNNDFRIEIGWMNGSTSASAPINRIKILGFTPEE